MDSTIIAIIWQKSRVIHLLKFEPFEWGISIGVFIFLKFPIIKYAFHLLFQM